MSQPPKPTTTVFTGHMNGTKPTDARAIQEAMSKMQKDDHWLLMAPNGKVWISTPNALMRALVPFVQHPFYTPGGSDDTSGSPG
jgi:hypothetical protein